MEFPFYFYPKIKLGKVGSKLAYCPWAGLVGPWTCLAGPQVKKI